MSSTHNDILNWSQMIDGTVEDAKANDDDNGNANRDFPLDELFDDLEMNLTQQSNALVDMQTQLESIETSLSHHSSSPSPSPTVSSSSRRSTRDSSKTRGNRNGSFVNLDNNDNDDKDKPVRTPSIFRVLQKRSSTNKKNHTKTSPPIVVDPALNGHGEPTIAQVPLPRMTPPQPIVKETSRDDAFFRPTPVPPQKEVPTPPSRYLSSSMLTSPTTTTATAATTPKKTTPTALQMMRRVTFGTAEEEDVGVVTPPPPPPRTTMYANHEKSSHTFDESDSSHSGGHDVNSDDNDDNISEMGETHATTKTWAFRSRPAKLSLVCVGITMVLLLGLVLGQFVARNQKEPSQPQQSSSLSMTDNNSSNVLDASQVNATIPSSPTARPSMAPMIDTLVDVEVEDLEVPRPAEPIDTNSTPAVVDEEVATIEDIDIAVEYDYTANTDYLVGVYYYPWHGENFHNGGGYVRKELQPRHEPTLGEYNDSDPAIIAKQMQWFRQANIGLLVTSWWGPNLLEDRNTKDVLMQHKDLGNLQIALHYETVGRLILGRENGTVVALNDIEYMCEHYFDHPNYYKIDGRPVVFIYVSRFLAEVGTLEETLLTMRSSAGKCGHNIYLIGDQVYASAPNVDEPHVPFWYFDAVTNYDVYGSAGRPQGYAGTESVDQYYEQQAQWRDFAREENCHYIPAVSPGYNDRAVRMEMDHPALSRRVTAGSGEGSLFHYQLKQAKQLVDRKVDNMILVNSFNEWHEDTQIEPVVGVDTTMPLNFTQGLEYVGYGELYLDILGAATSKDESQHTAFDYLFEARAT